MSPTARALQALAGAHGLIVMGGVHSPRQARGQTLYLLGTGPRFWPGFTESREYLDGDPNPLDRWSSRVLPEIAASLFAPALGVIYPFGGPPYAPFLKWAQDTGEAYQSPVGMLVHRKAGLMISYRGGIVIAGRDVLPADRLPSPCETTCRSQPCKTACPVDALSAERGYDVAACHAFLDTDAGRDCLDHGCKARRACPISERFGRDPAQSAFHMKSFHPK